MNLVNETALSNLNFDSKGRLHAVFGDGEETVCGYPGVQNLNVKAMRESEDRDRKAEASPGFSSAFGC
jgi:hypothetical protein